MRAGWLGVAGLFLLSAASPLWAGPFAEVRTDHWAYRSCARLTSLGILAQDRTGDFTGDPELTRFEFGIALLDPLSQLDTALDRLPAGSDADTQLRLVLGVLRVSPRDSEREVAGALSDLGRLATEFSDVLQSMRFDPTRASQVLRRVANEDLIRAWRLESLKHPATSAALAPSGSVRPALPETIQLPLAHGTVGLSLTSPGQAPELLDDLAKSAAAARALDLSGSGPAEPAVTDPRISRLRTSYEYGVGSTLTLSLAYEEIARRGQGENPVDAASLTSLGIGYQLTPSTSVKLSYSLLEYSNYALDIPPLRDRVAETAVSIEF